jgi:integrase
MPRITGQGSEQWTKRPEGWTLRMRWSCARDGGGYRVISKSFHGPTKADCREQAAEYKRMINTGMEHRGGSVRLGEYAETWHAAREQSGRYSYKHMANEARIVRHIGAIVGDVPLSDVTPATGRALVERMQADGIGRDTVRKAATALHLVVKQAAEEQRLPLDTLATWQRPARDRGRRKAMDAGTAARFRAEMMAEPMTGYVAAALIAVSAGLRIGECRALRWGDVTFETVGGVTLARLAVLRQHQPVEGEKTPKCGSVRTVWCDDEVTAWLQRYRAAAVDLSGDDDVADVLVCPSPRGGTMSISRQNVWWRGWCAGHGFDGYQFHSLRHTMATLRIAAGVDVKTVQQDGGWRSASVLMDIYAHSLPDAGVRSALAMSKSCQDATANGHA